jgi:diamine N-acetyltransferase
MMAADGVMIRRAGVEDVALLAQMGEEAFYTAYAGEIAHEPLAAFAARVFAPERVAAELEEQPGSYLIIEVDGEAAGLAQLRAREAPAEVNGSRPVELSKIYLLDQWIGRGLGAALMEACLEEARGQGYETMWLGVWERNPRAIGFYGKWGFEAVGEVPFPFEGEMQRDVVMMKGIGDRGSAESQWLMANR